MHILPYLKQLCSLGRVLSLCPTNAVRHLAGHRAYVEHNRAFLVDHAAHARGVLGEGITPRKPHLGCVALGRDFDLRLKKPKRTVVPAWQPSTRGVQPLCRTIIILLLFIN